MKGGLTLEIREQQKDFVKAYIALGCKNATQAAINAGYSPKTARQQASDLLTRPHIQEYLQAEKDALTKDIRDSFVFACKDAVKVEIKILNDEGASNKDRLAAAKDILDRAGFKPTDEVNLTGQVNNPFSGLSTDDLKRLIESE